MIEKFHKTIIFTKVPLTGFFRFSDKFQIYPAKLEKMPKSASQRHYPVILEYTIEEKEIIEPPNNITSLRSLRRYTGTILSKQDEILNLLSLFSNNLFFRYYDLTGNWGMPILNEKASDDEINSWTTKWCLRMFHWPELPEQLKINKFTELEKIYEPVEKESFMTYYAQNPNYDFDQSKSIIFPDLIELGLKFYYSLNNEDKEIVDDAISHSISAMELRQYRKTLSIISAFTAIETMVNIENKDFKPEKCPTCGQLQFKVSKKYRDFLLKYIGDSPENKKKFNNLYSLRSKIIHSGMILKSENLWDDIPQDEKDKEFIKQIEIITLSKLSIIFWLLKRETLHNTLYKQ